MDEANGGGNRLLKRIDTIDISGKNYWINNKNTGEKDVF